MIREPFDPVVQFHQVLAQIEELVRFKLYFFGDVVVAEGFLATLLGEAATSLLYLLECAGFADEDCLGQVLYLLLDL